ncbi:MAG TPA: glycosyltransferase family 4 protein [Caldilineae bacterium]|nr:glycosyltransferase family 4 protein [Caldilineae bacterium]
MSGRRVLVFGERIRPPADEGIKKLTVHLAQGLRHHADILFLTAHGADVPEWGCTNVSANRLLFGPGVARAVARSGADAVIYVPTASLTAATLLRAWLLRGYARGAPLIVVALQPRPETPLMRVMARLPGLQAIRVAVMSERTARQVQSLGLQAVWWTPGVDLDRFRPLDEAARAALRARYGFRDADFVVAHIGHIRAGRNLDVLTEFAQAGMRPLLVGSTSTPQEGALRESLEAAGVRVITEYLPRVEEIYQLCDAYLFPTPYAEGEVASIDVPLSVLEAMACDRPVVTTPFGGLPRLFAEGDGLLYARTEPEMMRALERIRAGIPVRTRQRVLGHSWSQAAEALLRAVLRGGPRA